MITIALLIICELIVRSSNAADLPMAPAATQLVKAKEKPALVKRAKQLLPKTDLVYNTHGSGPTWDIGGYPKTRENLIRHLSGEIGVRGHAGKVPREALERMTYTQLDRLHTNDHWGLPLIIEKSLPTLRPANPPRTFCPT